MREEADQENRDLSLKTKEDGVGRLVLNEPNHRLAIIGVLQRVEIDDAGDVFVQEDILQKEHCRTNQDGDARIQKQKGGTKKTNRRVIAPVRSIR